MASVEKTSSANYLSYLNPFNLLKIPSYIYDAVAHIFQKPNEPSGINRPVFIQGDDEKDGYVWPDGIQAYFDQSSNPYPTLEILLSDGGKIKIAKTWMSDIERLGEPDEFWINGEKIEPAPKTEKQKEDLIKKLQAIAADDVEMVRDWTEIWSYRPKMALMDEFMTKFKDKFKLNPMLGRNGFKKVTISLDTKSGLLTCHVSGEIEHGTDDNTDLHLIQVKYEAEMTYNMEKQFVTSAFILN